MKPLLTALCCLLPFGSIEAGDFNLNRNQWEAMPEVYHLKREKKGGASQKGNIVGGRLRYDRLKRYGYYWGLEGCMGKGTLHGASGAGHKLHSHYYNYEVEGRIGYTLQCKEGLQYSFTPFIGGGYLSEKNNFSNKAPLPLHTNIHFGFVEAGFIAAMRPLDPLHIGFELKLKMPYEPKCKISHDPEEAAFSQKIGERLQVRMEWPLILRFDCSSWTLNATPFYEYRNYGAHVNFPFDFIQTRYQIWGLSIGVGGWF